MLKSTEGRTGWTSRWESEFVSVETYEGTRKHLSAVAFGVAAESTRHFSTIRKPVSCRVEDVQERHS